LECKGNQLQTYLQGVLHADVPTGPLDSFVQQWVHVLSRLATRGLTFTDMDENGDFSDHFKTRICVIDEKNEHKLTHEKHPDIYIHSNKARRGNIKEYRAYLLVQCNSQSIGSRDLCNQCVENNDQDCNGSSTSFFMAEVFGMLHARYIAMPTYDTPVTEVENIDMPYLKYYLEQHPLHSNSLINALVISLEALINSRHVSVPSGLTIEFRAEEKTYLDSQSLRALPAALRIVMVAP